MSGYYEDDEPRRHRSHRTSRRPVYEEEVVESRGARPTRGMDLVRRRDSDESSEEIRREYPPGEGGYVQSRRYTRDKYAPAPARARSAGRHHGGGGFHDDRSDDDGRDRRRRKNGRDRTCFLEFTAA